MMRRALRGPLVWLPILLLVAFVVYRPALHGTLVWDDDRHVTRPDLQSAEGLARIWTEVGATQQYYPVVHTAFWIQHRLWGDTPFGYHAVNVGLHALSAWLVIVVLRRLTVPGAALAGLIFAVHPLHVESVAWITELKNTLSGVFYVSAAWLYLRFDERRRGLDYGAALACFLLALGSKTVTATLPLVLIVVFWWRRGTVDLRRDVRPLLPFAALGLAAGLTTIWVEAVFIEATGAEFALGPIERVLVAGRAIWFYLGKILWPAGLSFSYARWGISAAVWWQYAFVLAAGALAWAAWRARRRSRAPAAALACFVLTLLPALGFVNVYPFRFSFVADHFAYLASLPVIALVVATVAMGLSKLRGPSAAGPALASLVIGVPLAVVAWGLAHQYRDAETLYRATIERTPTSWMALGNLGALLVNQPGRTDEGVSLLREAIRLKPDLAEAHNNLGTVSLRQGRLDEALASFEAARRYEPRLAEAHNNACAALRHLRRLAEAKPACERALALAPDYTEAHLNLGIVAREVGDHAAAMAHLGRVLSLRPTLATALHHMGLACLEAGNIPAAVDHLRRAALQEPRAAVIQNDLAIALQRAGRIDEALQGFKTALDLDARYAGAAFNLGTLLMRLDRLADAIVAYRHALSLDPNDAWTHNNLGVALEALGRRAEALHHFERAAALAPGLAEAQANVARLRRR